ncbi:MAG: hypothetical protein WC055_00485 [Melioribacteraceae bacterium]
MSQFTHGVINPDTETGTQLALDLASEESSQNTNHSGASRPSYAVTGMIWIKTVSGTLHEIYYFDGTDDILVGSINPTTNTWGQTFTGLVNLAAGADIASAATIDLTAATGNSPRITGTTPTSAVTMNTGQQMVVVADGAWPLTYHATMNKLNTGSDYTCTAGDIISYSKDLSGVIHGIIHRVTWAESIHFTRDLAAASGNVSYTGFTFTPKSILITGIKAGATLSSRGIGKVGTNYCDYHDGTNWWSGTNYAVIVSTDSGVTNAQAGVVASSSPGEVTIAWTKSGTPTGTINLQITAFA